MVEQIANEAEFLLGYLMSFGLRLGETFWSALLGAIIGAIATFWVQRTNLAESRRQRSSELLLRKQTGAYAIVLKLMRIHMDLNGLRKYFESCFAKANSVTPPSEIWQTLQPLANEFAEITFSVDEMTVLLEAGENALFSEVSIVAPRHKSDIDAFKILTGRREFIRTQMPVGPSQGVRVSRAHPRAAYSFATANE